MNDRKLKDIHDMELHERLQLDIPNSNCVGILRVPGGWIYEYEISTSGTASTSTQFVPYHCEFDSDPMRDFGLFKPDKSDKW